MHCIFAHTFLTMRIKGSNNGCDKKHVPKMEFASELSVSEIQNSGDNLIDNADKLAAEEFSISLDSDVKFHDVDESIKLLIEFPCNDSIS